MKRNGLNHGCVSHRAAMLASKQWIWLQPTWSSGWKVICYAHALKNCISVLLNKVYPSYIFALLAKSGFPLWDVGNDRNYLYGPLWRGRRGGGGGVKVQDPLFRPLIKSTRLGQVRSIALSSEILIGKLSSTVPWQSSLFTAVPKLFRLSW